MRTRFTNISGKDRHFGFIPPHGVDLAAGEEHTIEGDITTVLAGGLNRYSRRREIAAFNNDVQLGRISADEIDGPSSSASSESASPSESPSASSSSSP